jgi:hypothetical protein
MKAAFKFAASVLLLVIATGISVAAIPCQAKHKSAMGCENDCPMMAMMHQAMEQSKANMNGASCCEISSQPTTPEPVQIVPERLAPVALLANGRGALVIPFAPTMVAKISTSDLRRNPSAAALLCTFLI